MGLPTQMKSCTDLVRQIREFGPELDSGPLRGGLHRSISQSPGQSLRCCHMAHWACQEKSSNPASELISDDFREHFSKRGDPPQQHPRPFFAAVPGRSENPTILDSPSNKLHPFYRARLEIRTPGLARAKPWRERPEAAPRFVAAPGAPTVRNQLAPTGAMPGAGTVPGPTM